MNGKIAIIVVWKGVMACRLGMAPSFSLWDTRSEHKLGRKARVSRSRNGVELSCIKISILDWFSDIRARIYDIILRALKLEQLGMSLRTILAWDFIENIAESQFWFSFRYSIPIGHRENEPRACNPPRQKYSTIAGQRYFILRCAEFENAVNSMEISYRDFTRIDRRSCLNMGRYWEKNICLPFFLLLLHNLCNKLLGIQTWKQSQSDIRTWGMDWRNWASTTSIGPSTILRIRGTSILVSSQDCLAGDRLHRPLIKEIYEW